eukprot:4115243-Pleurochrysis_carterae.AAC.1
MCARYQHAGACIRVPIPRHRHQPGYRHHISRTVGPSHTRAHALAAQTIRRAQPLHSPLLPADKRCPVPPIGD